MFKANETKELPLTRGDLAPFVSRTKKAVIRLRTSEGDWYAGMVVRIGIIRGCFYAFLRPLTHYHHAEKQNNGKGISLRPLFDSEEEISIRVFSKRKYPFFFSHAAKKISTTNIDGLLEIESDHELITISTRSCDIIQAQKLLGISDPVA